MKPAPEDELPFPVMLAGVLIMILSAVAGFIMFTTPILALAWLFGVASMGFEGAPPFLDVVLWWAWWR